VDDEAFDEEDFLNRRVSNTLNFNWNLLAQFKQGDIVKALGIPVTLYKDLYKKRILSSKQLAVIQSCIRVGDNGEASFIVPPPKSATVKLSERLQKRLILLRKKLSKKGALIPWENIADLIATNVVINPDLGIKTEQNIEKRGRQVKWRVRQLMNCNTLDEMPGLKRPHKFFEDAVARACGEYEQQARLNTAKDNRDKQAEYETRKAKRAVKRSAIKDISIPPVYWDSLINGMPMIMPPSHYKYKHASYG
jgi:hypothetical protein